MEVVVEVVVAVVGSVIGPTGVEEETTGTGDVVGTESGGAHAPVASATTTRNRRIPPGWTNGFGWRRQSP
ncbi:MAG TPA: hypothetical protein VJ398_07810 [Acidimicrobiia bacterium]|nr:hypothetical protein [Acidimicrobiia bacterium]